MIRPQTLKGFRDYLPESMIARERLMQTARDIYRSYGFSPIDTPALEYSEILLGKGGEESDKQLFRFTDQGARDVAMRFDLTVPFARFAAQHLHEIGTPFRRYHIGTVWRAEKPQKGRYREFIQCDFDTIGTESPVADAETLLVIHDLMVALGFERFRIRVNHRQVLSGLLESLGLADRSAAVLRALDKLPKIGRDAVIKEMTATAEATTDQAEKVLSFAAAEGTTAEVLAAAREHVGDQPTAGQGIDALQHLLDACAAAGVPEHRVTLDLSIARGLDYYTGTIYETFLDDLPEIGSVCSGGRYDHLASLFTKQPLPGVGASLGVDRLLAAMAELNLLEGTSTPADVLVLLFDEERTGDYLRIARSLRAAGLATEVFPQSKAVKKQMQYANRKGFQIAVIAGADEFDQGVWQVKNLQTGEQSAVAESELAEQIRNELANS